MTQTAITIRLGKAEDTEALIGLDTTIPYDKQRPGQIRKWIEANTCHVMQTKGSIIAYGVLHYHFFGNGFIEMLMVAQKYRRMHLGSQLISCLKQNCTQPKLFTSTNQSNIPMQNLLAQSGFKASGAIENLDPNDPEIIYFCDLKGEK